MMKTQIRLIYGITLLVIPLLITSCEDQTKASLVKVGDLKDGGIVFYVDATGQHGLICPELDQSNGIPWHSGVATLTNSTNTAIGQGQFNTNLIVSLQGSGSYAAKICDDLVLNGYDDWFLPSLYEVELMKTGLKDYGKGSFANTAYWSSTEFNLGSAYVMDFTSSTSIHPKTDNWHVRAARKF